MSKPEIVISGEKWLGKGLLSVYSRIEEIINEAKHSILIAVYQFTSRELITLIERALRRGVEVYIYTTEIADIHSHPNLKIHLLRDIMLHAKIIIVDGEKILIGSSNFTFSGFFKNYEVGVYLEDEEIAYKLTKLIKVMID
ncbi:MAG: hypothetical protein J7L63_01000 [Thermoplasmata archaeon]|nr:hypothetical protein [Thermoplasmata archaeon]